MPLQRRKKRVEEKEARTKKQRRVLGKVLEPSQRKACYISLFDLGFELMTVRVPKIGKRKYVIPENVAKAVDRVNSSCGTTVPVEDVMGVIRRFSKFEEKVSGLDLRGDDLSKLIYRRSVLKDFARKSLPKIAEASEYSPSLAPAPYLTEMRAVFMLGAGVPLAYGVRSTYSEFMKEVLEEPEGERYLSRMDRQIVLARRKGLLNMETMRGIRLKDWLRNVELALATASDMLDQTQATLRRARIEGRLPRPVRRRKISWRKMLEEDIKKGVIKGVGE